MFYRNLLLSLEDQLDVFFTQRVFHSADYAASTYADTLIIGGVHVNTLLNIEFDNSGKPLFESMLIKFDKAISFPLEDGLTLDNEMLADVIEHLVITGHYGLSAIINREIAMQVA